MVASGSSSGPKISLGRAVPQPFLGENLLVKTPYKFKNSYGSTPEPQTAQDAPWQHGLSLNKSKFFSAHSDSQSDW
jgi:hypothetical protein